MRNNETGEFELVVGNRQLLSGFFIVVLLFAVGVALGYILGQNSEKSLKPADVASTIPQTSPARPQPVLPSAGPPAVQPDAAQPGSGQSGSAAAPATQPVQAPPQPVAAPAVQPPAASAAPAPAEAEAVSEPKPGTYWQVMAVARPDAEIMVRTLKDKGFPAVTSPGTKGLTRVLVGPYPDRLALSKAKTDLEAAGMAPPYRVEVGGDSGHK